MVTPQCATARSQSRNIEARAPLRRDGTVAGRISAGEGLDPFFSTQASGPEGLPYREVLEISPIIAAASLVDLALLRRLELAKHDVQKPVVEIFSPPRP